MVITAVIAMGNMEGSGALKGSGNSGYLQKPWYNVSTYDIPRLLWYSPFFEEYMQEQNYG